MERRLNKKIETYITSFKNEIKDKITSLQLLQSPEQKETVNELLEFIYEYNRLTLEKDDFAKRKRVKNSIPNINRCIAKRANGEQCTRRRKDNCDYCGTHSKGIPHGEIDTDGNTTATTNTHKETRIIPNTTIIESKNLQYVEVTAEDIQGIVYYIDIYNNVYKTEDILEGIENPRIIAKAVKQGDIYSIPEFDLGVNIVLSKQIC